MLARTRRGCPLELLLRQATASRRQVQIGYNGHRTRTPMTASGSPDVTELLVAWSNGDPTALDKLVPLIYGELHRMARRYMQQAGPGHTLQTTALVNEAYLRLV